MGRHQILTTINVALLACSVLLAAWIVPVFPQEKGRKSGARYRGRDITENAKISTQRPRLLVAFGA